MADITRNKFASLKYVTMYLQKLRRKVRIMRPFCVLRMEIHIGLVLRPFNVRHLFNTTYQFTPLINFLVEFFLQKTTKSCKKALFYISQYS